MNVLLIYPKAAVSEDLPLLPLGLAYLGRVIEQSGYNVKVIDLNIQSELELEKLVPWADLAGISTVTFAYHNSKSILEKVKRIKPNIFTVMGGPHPASLPAEVLKEKFIDAIIMGEGEVSFKNLCNCIKAGQTLDSVRGAGYKKNSNIVINPPETFIANLDDLPFPAYHLFPDLSNYSSYGQAINVQRREVRIITSRGCPYDCVFCFKSIYGNNWRARSAKNVVDEWAWAVKEHKAEQIAIVDDTFNIDIKRALEICNLVISRDLIVPWHAPNGIRADRITEELLVKMKKSGCFRLSFGVESGCQEIVDGIDKKLDLKKVEETFRLCKKTGIKTAAFFILGLPGENYRTMKKTIAFAKKLNPEHVHFTIASPFPGTRLYNLVKKDGKLLRDWANFAGLFDGTANFQLGELTPELMEKMWRKAYRSFYLRPGFIIKKIFDPTVWRNIKKYKPSKLFHYFLGG